MKFEHVALQTVEGGSRSGERRAPAILHGVVRFALRCRGSNHLAIKAEGPKSGYVELNQDLISNLR